MVPYRHELQKHGIIQYIHTIKNNLQFAFFAYVLIQRRLFLCI